MKILHTEASWGWGGQEIRILREAIGLRERGHEIYFAVVPGGDLVLRARDEGFEVREISFLKKDAFFSIPKLLKLMRLWNIDIVNTHSSADAWIAGIAARIANKKIIRTRHLSTAIRKGLNSRILFNRLVDYVVTTCSEIVPKICAQSGLSEDAIECIATGLDPSKIEASSDEIQAFKERYQIADDQLIVGTLCFLRDWKGIEEFLEAAKQLEKEKITWIIVGGGEVERYLLYAQELGLKSVIFAGLIEPPFVPLAAMDIFLLLSTANEGISQASLQAAYMKKPLITTPTGGLPEVCLHERTGFVVPVRSSERVAEAVSVLAENKALREEMGNNAHKLVLEKFTYQQMLDRMENVYHSIAAANA